MAIYDIPDFNAVQASSSQYLGSYTTPCNSASLPGTVLTCGGPSRLCFETMNIFRFTVCTDIGIYAVTMSPTICSINLLHTLVEKEQQDPDISLGFHRAFLRYYDYAVGLSYKPGWSSISSRVDCVNNTSAFRRFIAQETPASTNFAMDETSGRVVMADSEESLAVYYFSLYDVDK